jgi:type VI secretion system secreted protein VgrG
MPAYTQTNRPLAVTTPLGPDAVLLARLSGYGALSEPFVFELELLAEDPVSFPALLGQAASVRLEAPGCPLRHVNGIVRSLTEAGQVRSARGGVTFRRYRAELVPKLWLLSLRQDSRVFQAVSVKDVLHTVLGGWQIDLHDELTGTYLPRDYCVQYRETDLAFVSRLMEEEGIFYYFTHAEDRHTLVLADSPEGHPDLPGLTSLPFDPGAGAERLPGRVTAWAKTQAVRPCKVTLRDHKFELPDSTLEAGQPILHQVRAGKAEHDLAVGEGDRLEVYDYPGGYAPRFDGVSVSGQDQAGQLQHLFKESVRVAHLRVQEQAALALAAEGKSAAGHLLPGFHFDLAGHGAGDGPYVLTRVAHRADLEGAYLADADSFSYENDFRALPKALPYRPPRRTHKPVIPGTQTAVVVGPAGDEIFPDKYGRVKVKFHWDRRQGSGPESSCWLRVAQVWAGNRWGAFFWPRVGHEVVVAFENGDPDRPIVVGSVYNADNMPPLTMPQHMALAGIKSFSTGGGASLVTNPLANFNGVVFDDRAGIEHVELHGERHITFQAEESQWHHVNGPQTLNVADTQHVRVGRLGAGGSGSGRGDREESFYASFQTDLASAWGASVTSVCGVKQTSVVGVNSSWYLGNKIDIQVNPSYVLSDAALASASTGIAATLAALVVVPQIVSLAAARTWEQLAVFALTNTLARANLVVGNRINSSAGVVYNLHRGVFSGSLNDDATYTKSEARPPGGHHRPVQRGHDPGRGGGLRLLQPPH